VGVTAIHLAPPLPVRDVPRNVKTFFPAKMIHRIGARNLRDKKSLLKNLLE
jgi:hypothetical protein